MATINVDWTNGTYASITLSDVSNTITFTEREDGEGMVLDPRFYHLKVVQGSGLLPKAITSWPNNVLFPAGTLPSLSLIAGQEDIIQFLEIQVTPEENDFVYYAILRGSNFS